MPLRKWGLTTLSISAHAEMYKYLILKMLFRKLEIMFSAIDNNEHRAGYFVVVIVVQPLRVSQPGIPIRGAWKRSETANFWRLQ